MTEPSTTEPDPTEPTTPEPTTPEPTTPEPVASDRRPSLAGRLARLGFTDAGRAQRLVREAEAVDGVRLEGALLESLLGALGGTADPDLALGGLLRLLAAADEHGEGAELRAALAEEDGTRDRLTAVLGASAALGDHLVRHPAHWHVLRDHLAGHGDVRAELLAAVGARPGDTGPVAASAGAGALAGLRAEY
ncbi:hypothetical protein ACFQ11_28495, partial [Actinomadura sediminis]